MHIAEVAPLAESVPPKLYGGTERVVSWLTDALLDLNCSVTLFASGDSKTRARLVAVCPQALRLSKPAIDPAVATSALIDAVAAQADEFDLIHWHTDWLHLPLTRYIKRSATCKASISSNCFNRTRASVSFRLGQMVEDWGSGKPNR